MAPTATSNYTTIVRYCWLGWWVLLIQFNDFVGWHYYLRLKLIGPQSPLIESSLIEGREKETKKKNGGE